MTVFLVIAGILGSIGGRFAFETIFNSIGTKVSNADKLANVGEPAVYDGPTFSLRLPGHVAVQHVSKQGVELTLYGSDQGDVYMGVAVSDLPPESGYDFAAGAEGIRKNIGGKIASDTALEVAGRPAHDLMFTGVEGGKATSWTRIVVDNTRVYQIMVVVTGRHTERPADYVTALDSFVMR